jgi:hypothetical protein
MDLGRHADFTLLIPRQYVHRRFGVIPEVRPEPMALAGRDPEIVRGRD